jgi:hypothetical protein
VSNLNPRQFFHGTHAELNEGDYIEPGNQPHHRMSEGNPYHDASKVYVTPYPHVAAQYSWKKPSPDADYEPGHIYEVEPEGRLLKDAEIKAQPHMPQDLSYTAKRARVVRRYEG